MTLNAATAIVTGAGSGIGLAIAKALGSRGAHVVIAELDAARGKQAEAMVRQAGGTEVCSVVCDVSDEGAVSACCDDAEKRFGSIDMIVNNAGLMTFGPLEKFTSKDWIRVLSVDLMGAVHFTAEAFRRMKRGGAIVNMSSVHAIETEPNVAPYAAAKTALLSLTRSASIEGRSRHIRANAVLPGAVDTPMLWENPNVRSGAEKIPAGGIGKPEQVAAAVVFLLSDEASFISGAMLRVDGGRLAMLDG